MARKNSKSAADVTEDQFEMALAEREQGATKKRQCEILGINYNTKRLDEMLENYLSEKEHRKEMMRKNRTKPLTPQEEINMAEAYLTGDAIEEIAKRYYRSPALVRRRLELMGLLDFKLRESADPLNPAMVPEEAMSERFAIGQKVWVPGYKCLGEVMAEHKPNADGIYAYRVYLLASNKHRNVNFYAYDLGSLKYLEEKGIDPNVLQDNMSREDIVYTLNAALLAARKNANKGK